MKVIVLGFLLISAVQVWAADQSDCVDLTGSYVNSDGTFKIEMKKTLEAGKIRYSISRTNPQQPKIDYVHSKMNAVIGEQFSRQDEMFSDPKASSEGPNKIAALCDVSNLTIMLTEWKAYKRGLIDRIAGSKEELLVATQFEQYTYNLDSTGKLIQRYIPLWSSFASNFNGQDTYQNSFPISTSPQLNYFVRVK